MVLSVQEVTLAIISGALLAVLYSLRVLILMERRVARMEAHIEKIVTHLGKTIGKRRKK